MYDPANKRLGMREADTSLLMFGFYIWNNVRIGFQTFAGGLLVGVGSIWFLGANGVIIGAVAGYLDAGRLRRDLLVVRRRPFVARAARHRALGRRRPAPRPRGDRAGQPLAQGRAGGRGEAGGAHDVRRGAHVLRRRLRRGVLVAAHRDPVRRQDRRRHRRLGRCSSPTSCSPDARVQPADIAIALRRRSPWEAIDLGLQHAAALVARRSTPRTRWCSCRSPRCAARGGWALERALARDLPDLVAEAALRPRRAARAVARGVRRGADRARSARPPGASGWARACSGALDLRPLRPRALVQPAGAPARGPARRARRASARACSAAARAATRSGSPWSGVHFECGAVLWSAAGWPRCCCRRRPSARAATATTSSAACSS